MRDIYDEAILATMEHDNIIASWLAGGKSKDMPLHGLLFRSCPNLGKLCLTERKSNIYDNIEAHEDAEPLITALKLDDLIPTSQWALERQWDNNTEEERTEMLERFAMYNRELDELYDRESVDVS